jgi:hypothetical protein
MKFYTSQKQRKTKETSLAADLIVKKADVALTK